MNAERIVPGMLARSQPGASAAVCFLYSHAQQRRVSVADEASDWVVIPSASAVNISKSLSDGPIEPPDADVA